MRTSDPSGTRYGGSSCARTVCARSSSRWYDDWMVRTRAPSRSGRPASRAAVMNACRRVCGPIALSTPARRATRRTMRLAQCRSMRCPSGRITKGPASRPPMARSTARVGARRERDGYDLAALPPDRARSGRAAGPVWTFREMAASSTRVPTAEMRSARIAVASGLPSSAVASVRGRAKRRSHHRRHLVNAECGRWARLAR